MRRALFLVVMLLPVLTQAQDIAPERMNEFLAVMADNGCRVSNATAEEIMPAAGFHDKDEVKAIIGQLMAEDKASLIDGQVIVQGGSCGTDAPEYTTRERFLAAVAYNGCQMTAGQSNELLPPMGVERGQIKPLIGQMISMGEVALSQDNQIVYMEQSLCDKFDGMAEKIAPGKMALATANLAAAEAAKADERVKFLSYMKTVDCQISREDLSAAITDEGFDFDRVQKVIKDLSDEGLLHENAAGDTLIVKPEACG
jgi:hypothetical protein